jgi:hypothetical protein
MEDIKMFLKPEVHTILFQEIFILAKEKEEDFVNYSSDFLKS